MQNKTKTNRHIHIIFWEQKKPKHRIEKNVKKYDLQ